MGMKITNRNAKEDVSGKHNDRNFDVDYAEHIDQSRMHENIYWSYNGNNECTFEELEREFYEVHFRDCLEQQNQKHKEARNYSRVKTMLQYYHNKRTRPEDKILQIGNAKEHATKEELWDCALEYRDRFEELYGEHCKILDMALHMDEATPHVHIRRVWIAEEEETGWKYVNESKALEQLGIPIPRPDMPESKYNNAKIMITQNEVEMFRQICIDRGLDIDEPSRDEKRREHLSVLEYKKEKAIEETEKAEQEMDEFNENALRFIKENPFLLNLHAERLMEAERKSRAERNKIIAEIVCREYERIMTEGFEGAIKSQMNESFARFIEEKGLMDEYDSWVEEHEAEVKSERDI